MLRNQREIMLDPQIFREKFLCCIIFQSIYQRHFSLFMTVTVFQAFYLPLQIFIMQSSGPQAFWHQQPVLWKAIFLRTGGRGAGRGGDGLGGDASDGEWQMKFCLLAAHLLLCNPVPNTPRTSTGPRPGGWGPLMYSTSQKVQICIIRIYCIRVM